MGARLSSDAAYVKSMVGNQVALIVQNLATIIAGLTLAFTANWQLSLVVLCLVPMLGVAGSMQMKALQGFSESAKVRGRRREEGGGGRREDRRRWGKYGGRRISACGT